MIAPASPENIARAAKLLRKGKLVAFPTETVYGLGADATNDQAVREIFKVKGRPASDPLIVHLSSIENFEKLADTTLARTKLDKLARFWPGPLSVVLPKKDLVPESVTAGLGTVALRIPSHPVALELLRVSQIPIAAPSANPFCYVSPTEAKHVDDQLGKQIELILDGGPCQVGIESTVLSLVGSQPKILRPGLIHRELIEEALGECVSDGSKVTDAVAALPAPGMFEKHYSPKTRLRFSDEINPSELHGAIGLIKFREDFRELPYDFDAINTLSSDENPKEIAANLYKAIREQDLLGLDLILVDRCEEKGIGIALMDRLRRATSR